MATNFPGSLDAFTNPTSSDTLDNPPHDQQHADVNDAVEALQAKVGVDGSAVTSSLDYKVANFTNKLGSGAAVRTLGTFVGGDVLQAAELNAIGTWTDFTPSMATTSGIVGTITIYEAKYQKINELVIGTLFFRITSLGTGSGSFRFDLPVAWAADSVGTTRFSGIGHGRENQTTGKSFQVFPRSSTEAGINYYDNSNPVAAGVGGGVFFIYRAA